MFGKKKLKVQKGWEKICFLSFLLVWVWGCVANYSFPLHTHTDNTSTNTIDVDFSFVLFYGIQQIIFAHSPLSFSHSFGKGMWKYLYANFLLLSLGCDRRVVYYVHIVWQFQFWKGEKRNACNIKSSFFFTFLIRWNWFGIHR